MAECEAPFSTSNRALLRALQPIPEFPDSVPVAHGTTIGRASGVTIRISSPSISRLHACIDFRNGAFTITDLGSKNGTFINGRRIKAPAVLRDGDRISFDRFEFLFETRPAPPGKGKKYEEDRVDLIDDDLDPTVTLVQPISTVRSGDTLFGIASKAGRRDCPEGSAARLRAIYRACSLLRSAGGAATICESVLDLIFEAIPARRGAVFLDDARSGVFEALTPVAFKESASNDKCAPMKVSRTILKKCYSERSAILVRDAFLDDRFSAAQSIVINEIRAAIAVPLLAGEVVFGIVYVDGDSSSGRFDEEDLAFLSMLCGEIALNIEHARLQREISRSERLAAIGQTITGAAHNVKNLLQLAQGGVDLLEQTLADGDIEASKACYNVAASGLRQLGQLVHDMLDYARGGSAMPVRCHPAQIVREAIDAGRPTFEASGIALDLSIGPTPEILADPNAIRRAVENILVNAADALKDREMGRLLVATQTDARGWAAIRIEDNGPGISKTHLERIFDPFFSTKGPGGTGLGLAITRKAVEDCGGEIRAESEMGHGAVFTLLLPPAVPPETAQ